MDDAPAFIAALGGISTAVVVVLRLIRPNRISYHVEIARDAEPLEPDVSRL